MDETKNYKASPKWYHKPITIVIAILAIGPFAIPMVWLSPAFKRWQKVAITILLILLTIWLAKATAGSVEAFRKHMQRL